MVFMGMLQAPSVLSGFESLVFYIYEIIKKQQLDKFMKEISANSRQS